MTPSQLVTVLGMSTVSKFGAQLANSQAVHVSYM